MRGKDGSCELMHTSSFCHMASLVERYLSDKAGTPITVIDIGSTQVDEVNGCYKPLFDKAGWSYVGVDIAGRGPEVALSVTL